MAVVPRWNSMCYQYFEARLPTLLDFSLLWNEDSKCATQKATTSLKFFELLNRFSSSHLLCEFSENSQTLKLPTQFSTYLHQANQVCHRFRTIASHVPVQHCHLLAINCHKIWLLPCTHHHRWLSVYYCQLKSNR